MYIWIWYDPFIRNCFKKKQTKKHTYILTNYIHARMILIAKIHKRKKVLI
jgi:hypothetical protein